MFLRRYFIILQIFNTYIPVVLLSEDSKDESEVAEKVMIGVYLFQITLVIGFRKCTSRIENIKLFKQQRAEQLEAIKSFKKITDQEKQYTLLKLMADKIFSVIQESRGVIEASYFIPGVSEFPLDENVKNSLSNILENVVLFSEITLRFPDVASRVLRSNNTWDILFQWGIAFTHQMKYILDTATIKLLKLVSQELNHVEKDANYVNPYKKNSIIGTKHDNVEQKYPSTKNKKYIKRRPKLSHHEF